MAKLDAAWEAEQSRLTLGKAVRGAAADRTLEMDHLLLPQQKFNGGVLYANRAKLTEVTVHATST